MKPSFSRLIHCIRFILAVLGVIYVARTWIGFSHHQPVQTPVVLAVTLATAALIWLPSPTVRGWAWLAFLTLGFGNTLVLLTGSSWAPVALCVVAAAGIRLWYLHRRQCSAGIVVVGTQVYIPVAMKLGRSLESSVGDDEQAHGASVRPVVPNATITASLQPSGSNRSAPIVRVENPPQPSEVHNTVAHDFSESVRRARHTFAAVVGMEKTKHRLLHAARDVLEGNGRTRNGILLSGPPGNGKTFFAEALAGQLGLPILSIAYGDVASKWVNETPQKVRAIFSEAKRVGPCVLFIDEFDSFIKSRSGDEHSMNRDLTNVVLTETVSLRGAQAILVAATNLFDALDGAGIREGRFDFKIEVPAPDLQARVALLERSIREELGDEFVEDEAIARLAKRWEGFSAARLSALGAQLRELHRDGQFQGPVTDRIGMMAMRLLQGRKGALPENVKDVADIVMPDASRSVLKDLAFKMARIDSLERLGATLPTGVIFAGPPGTGKTQAAMALAKASGWAFLPITGGELAADSRAWDRVWRDACDIRPVIVFLDEADGVLQDRRLSAYGTLTEKILTSMDGAAGRVRDVLFIAATNHPDRIDAAALRSRRFEERVAFDVPGAVAMAEFARAAFLRKLGNRWKVQPHVIEKLIEVLRGRTIADAEAVIERVVGIAALRRMRQRTTDIRLEDVVFGAKEIIGS